MTKDEGERAALATCINVVNVFRLLGGSSSNPQRGRHHISLCVDHRDGIRIGIDNINAAAGGCD